MLELKVYDGEAEVVLRFEHSLLALSKWESKYKIPFMDRRQKSPNEMLDYFQCMLLSPDVDPDLVFRIPPAQLDELTKYINDPMSAATAPKDPDAKKSSEVLTSDVIYYQMTALKINWEAQTWHLNRLMMLIAITAHKQQPEKKRSKIEALSDWRELNRKNRERFNSQG